jgi:hypothetical protein
MKWLTGIALVIGLYFCHLGLDYPTSKHRFRLTVNVETPSGTRSGSSVMEAVVNRQPGWFGLKSGMISHASLDGEAVFVDLGKTAEGKPINLIALLAWGPLGERSYDFADIHRQAYFDYLGIRGKSPGEKPERPAPIKMKLSARECESGGDTWCLIGKYPVGTKMEIRNDLIPTLITVGNVADPRSAMVIQPDSLHGVFGDGFRLGTIILEIVKSGSWPLSMFGLGGEPMTHQIEANLPNIVKAIQTRTSDDSFQQPRSFVLHLGQLKT